MLLSSWQRFFCHKSKYCNLFWCHCQHLFSLCHVFQHQLREKLYVLCLLRFYVFSHCWCIHQNCWRRLNPLTKMDERNISGLLNLPCPWLHSYPCSCQVIAADGSLKGFHILKPCIKKTQLIYCSIASFSPLHPLRMTIFQTNTLETKVAEPLHQRLKIWKWERMHITQAQKRVLAL